MNSDEQIRGRRRVNNFASFFLQNLYNMKILALLSLSAPLTLSFPHTSPPSPLHCPFSDSLWYLFISVSGTNCPCHYNIRGFHTYIPNFEENLLAYSLIFPKLTLFLAETFKSNQSAALVRAFHHLLSSLQICWLHRLSHCTISVL